MDTDPMIHYQWQNPVLRDTIYPFRKEKLRDFLRTYHEIDLLKKSRATNGIDPALQDRLNRADQALKDERQSVAQELQHGIAEKIETDKWFAAVTGRDEKNLRFKRTYYLDRQIVTLNERQADLIARQSSLRKRVDWYPEEDTRRNLWIERAAELDPEIAAVTAQLDSLRRLRDLFTREERLPKIDAQRGISLEEAMRWEVFSFQKELEGLDHPDLVKSVVERIESQPPRFEKWLTYMVFHFSGMRYRSAHASWADPKFLLEQISNEFLRADIQTLDDQAVAAACQEAVRDLQEERAGLTDAKKIRSIDVLIQKLTQGFPRRALQDYRAARLIGDVQSLPDDEPVILGRLEILRKARQQGGMPIPDWVWKEIEKYTSLRLKTQNKDWEAISPDRWKFENRRWREILDAWEKRDITGWRKQHEETLDLIVTRAVCNEIAEHIQHLRGNIPAAGLTGKPKWYLYWQEKTKDLPRGDPRKAYLVQAPAAEHFVNGASILWLDWVDTQPNPWQIAQPLPGYNMLGDIRMPRVKTTSNVEWAFHQLGNNFVRTRRKPTIRELRQAGRSAREIDAIRDEMRRFGGFVKQYLRWTHEATVIGVEELIDGKYVLTFETGQIGLVMRRLSDLVGNPKVFVGYVPKSPNPPEGLDDMIDRSKLLLE